MAVPARAISASAASLDVALVYMPFAIPERPSIQLGLLGEIARREGHRCDCHHLNLELAARIPDIYGGLCAFRGHMTGEWLFSYAAFGADAHQDDDAYLDAFPSELVLAARGGVTRARFIELRRTILPDFIEHCATLQDWGQYDVVGFSSSFQQHCASLALARRIKQRWPHVAIVFGGANLEGDMGEETARAFPFVDYVATGEGDLSFPALLRAIADGERDPAVEGIATGARSTPARMPFTDLDSSPLPNYDEYFGRFGRLGLAGYEKYLPALPLETARGCWWGQKHHCTFCGLNGSGMTFRSKSADRALHEMRWLATRYGQTMFQSTDNILDMSYLRDVFPRIEEARDDYTFFFEVKSNVTRDQLAQMRRGGVVWIQPGIESLSTHVLKLMDKGCTMLQNVRLLKWALYYRIRVGWNLIWGFPGETARDFADERTVMAKIPHLEPPNAVNRVWLERFSPMYHDRRRFPARFVSPERSYGYVYPDQVQLDRIAYFFNYALDGTTEAADHAESEAMVAQWTERWHGETRPTLFFRRIGATLWISDARGDTPTTHRFEGPLGLAYMACSDTMLSPGRVAERVNAELGENTLDERDARAVLDMFCERDLMLGENDLYLAIALPSNPNW